MERKRAGGRTELNIRRNGMTGGRFGDHYGVGRRALVVSTKKKPKSIQLNPAVFNACKLELL